MKYFIFMLLLVSTDPLKVTKINSIKSDANEAFKAKNYQEAAKHYSLLTDSLGIEEDEILLNLAHSYFNLKDTTKAKYNYLKVSGSNKNIKSIAQQQLGVLAKDGNKLEEALQYFKSSIKSNPKNADAKYDYEVIKKILEHQKENQDENQENKDDKEKEDIEPSEFAKQVKAKSDILRRDGNFKEALVTLQEGLKIDETVAAYNQFIKRLEKITGE
ncbi:MAG: hypothetical protein JXR03_03635 [Cyclobacteriaceae bacterium]